MLNAQVILTVSVAMAFAPAVIAAEPMTAPEAIAAYAKAWKTNRELLPPLRAELKTVIRNHDLQVSEVKTRKLENGATIESRRDPESTNIYRVFRDADRLRVRAITPASEVDLLRDLLVLGPDWRAMQRGVLVIRRRDQIGGMPSVDPYDMQSPEFRFDSPDELARSASSPAAKEVSYSITDDGQGRLEIRNEFGPEIFVQVTEYDLSDGMRPVRYRQYLDDQITSDQTLEYQDVGERGGRICIKRTWRMRPDGKMSVAGEPKGWYTELTYELQKIVEMTEADMVEVFSLRDFQSPQISDLRSLEPN